MKIEIKKKLEKLEIELKKCEFIKDYHLVMSDVIKLYEAYNSFAESNTTGSTDTQASLSAKEQEKDGHLYINICFEQNEFNNTILIDIDKSKIKEDYREAIKNIVSIIASLFTDNFLSIEKVEKPNLLKDESKKSKKIIDSLDGIDDDFFSSLSYSEEHFKESAASLKEKIKDIYLGSETKDSCSSVVDLINTSMQGMYRKSYSKDQIFYAGMIAGLKAASHSYKNTKLLSQSAKDLSVIFMFLEAYKRYENN